MNTTINWSNIMFQEVFKLLGRKGILLNSSINMDIADKVCDTVDSALVCSDVTDLIYGHGLKDVDIVSQSYLIYYI